MRSLDHSWKNILLFFLPFFYLYIRVINSYINLVSTGNVEGRANYIIFFTLIGFSLLREQKISTTIASAFIFTLYMMINPLLEGLGNIIQYMASYIIWPIIFYITYNLSYKEKDIKLIGYLGALTCNIIAFLYIILTNMNIYSLIGTNNAVAGSNSIYYVLLLCPFIFLVKNRSHVLLLTLLPIASFLVSTKSTCILSFIIILSYYTYTTFTGIRLSKKFFLLIGGSTFIYFISLFFNFSDTFFDLQKDINSGGNGRSDIALRVLDNFLNHSSLSEMLLGHGANAVSKTIHIGAHNDFLETLYNYGLIGIGLFFLFWYNLIKNIRYLKKDSEEKRAYVISLIVFFVCCMVSKLLGTQIQMLLLAIFWGIVLKQNDTKYEDSTYYSI